MKHFYNKKFNKIENSILFKLLLAFAAGSLLADIFLHLLPEESGKANEHFI